MKLLITGSSGHLGEGLMRTLPESAHELVGIDIKQSAFTTQVGTISEALSPPPDAPADTVLNEVFKCS